MTPGPVGVVVAVWRRGDAGIEWLLLHRAHWGSDVAGDWAWGSPGGWCDALETPEEAAARELEEEAGLSLELVRTDCGTDDYVVFTAEAPHDAPVVLSPEHDAYEWLPLEAALPRCLPALVADLLACVAATLTPVA